MCLVLQCIISESSVISASTPRPKFCRPDEPGCKYRVYMQNNRARVCDSLTSQAHPLKGPFLQQNRKMVWSKPQGVLNFHFGMSVRPEEPKIGA